MAELLAVMVRTLQTAVGFAILYIIFAPFITLILPFIWPFLVIGSIFGLYNVLGSIATRLEEAKER